MTLDRNYKIAFVTVCLLLIGVRSAFDIVQRVLGAYLHKESVPLRSVFSTVPNEIGAWQAVGTDQVLDESFVEELGTRSYLNRDYKSSDTRLPQLRIHVAYYTGMIDPVPHVPDRCFEAAGLRIVTMPRNLELPLDQSDWVVQADRIHRATGHSFSMSRVKQPFTGEESLVTMPIGECRLRVTEFEDALQPEARIFAGYFFLANGRTTPTPDGVKRLAFNLTEQYAYYCKVQLTATGGRGFDEAQFLEMCTDFLNEFLPQVMRCLPDWWEIDSQTPAADANDDGGP